MLLLFVGINFCTAQDTTVLLSPALFDKTTDQILIGAKDGWYFKAGNDTTWAKKDMDISSWKKMKPVELSVKLADKNGKVEGWFRLKIKLDESFKNTSLGLNTGTWAASDVYLDGQWLGSSGNTGSNGAPFKENRIRNGLPIQIDLSAGKEYIIALHVVDYVSPFPPARLQSEDSGLPLLITLTGPKFILIREKNTITWTTYPTIWNSVCAVLSLLFWLLYIQNPKEKNLLLIALCVTFFTLNGFCTTASGRNSDLSYVSDRLVFYGTNLFGALMFIMIPLILANVFKRKVTVYLKLFLIVFVIVFNSVILWPSSIIVPICVFALFGVCIYYVVSSWKHLRGAQWAIVAGIMLTLFWSLLYVINDNGSLPLPYELLYITGIVLSIPLGLLVYVSLRFKEIIKEVNDNAKQVVQLSEEKKDNALHQQKILQEEVNRQTAEIRTTLDNLKATQSQLIQSEKMASLGELTAGIAHEIQNPLNFVNNFSEVNKELVDEMQAELKAGKIEDAIAISNDIKENEEKINHHGKRADAIVKGMLQHSRSSSGVKEPTDINALADEYLRLAYHGLRAKDKSFNATMKTDFDKTIGNINIIPQDIGRVILNLITNAFYVVDEKKKQNPTGYEPLVTVSTKALTPPSGGRGVMIKVEDNGNGIPQKVLDKIFQPFFTTKPTGQGTGLGLSLSYDIVKAHGGELKVETNEGEGSVFIFQLPTA